MNNSLAPIVRLGGKVSVWTNIETWLEKCKMKSKNTAKTYETAVRDFFTWLCNKRLEDLKPEEIIINGTILVQYQTLLKDKKLKNNTVNTKMGAIRSLYKFIQEDYEDIKSEWFNKIERLDEEEDSENYGELYMHEVEQMIELVKHTYKGLEKQLLIEFAVTTSFRKESILKLKWSDIVYNPDENLYLFPTYKKRNKDIKPIKPEQYERLLQLKKKNKEYIFGLSNTTIQNMMNKLKEQMNIDPNRNITFHSFKNIAINFACKDLQDPSLAQTQGGHKSFNTTKKFYIKANKRFGDMPGIRIWDKPDYSKIDEADENKLRKAISECSETTKREILIMLEKLNQTSN